MLNKNNLHSRKEVVEDSDIEISNDDDVNEDNESNNM